MVGCQCNGEYQTTADQMRVTSKVHNGRARTENIIIDEELDKDRMMVCSRHLFHVLKGLAVNAAWNANS